MHDICELSHVPLSDCRKQVTVNYYNEVPIARDIDYA